MDFFRAFQAIGTSVPTYFIESTAPNNIDDLTPSDASALPDQLRQIDPPDEAIKSMAKELAEDSSGRPNSDPNLVILVHGFNNPRADVLNTYVAAATAIQADPAIKPRRGLVCVGYRWPSEKMGQPILASGSALPAPSIWIFWLGVGLVALSVLFLSMHPTVYQALAVFGSVMAGLVLTAILLRTVVYFRDNFRAIYYGIPDLIQIIRSIDHELVRLRGKDAERVQLSFIGHSMGGVVVTNTLRTLSDLFEFTPPSLSSFGINAFTEGERPTAKIGNAFELKRFVLASPDIPAETLLSSRGNFLASTVGRFDEAYLFSNEGDEVLRQISTLANYFSFPTKSRNHGFRLGNVEILSRDYGVVSFPQGKFLAHLRVGKMTIQQLYDRLQDAARRRQAAAMTQSIVVKPVDTPPLPMHFSYFDCTDYIDRREKTARDIAEPSVAAAGGTSSYRPLLTFGLRRKRANETARLPWYWHLWLLLSYIALQKPNVHGGYFEGELGRRLIFRLACLGYEETMDAFEKEGGLSAVCEAKQIRVMFSPKLKRRGNARGA